MKKNIFTLLIIMTLISAPTFASSSDGSKPINKDSEEYAALTARLTEINEMDKSTLTRPEKKALRKEVKDIKKQQSDGLYISVGAAIIIVLLLVILL